MAVDLLGGVCASMAVDAPKCYDHLPLAVLAEVAERVGVPARAYRPMLAAYARPRIARLDGLADESALPVQGLTPGCPAGTDWLAMAMACCSDRIRAVAPGAVPIFYDRGLVAYGPAVGGSRRLGGYHTVWRLLWAGAESRQVSAIHVLG